MVAAQNDLYMVCASGESNNDNVAESINSGNLTLGELQRSAKNICEFLLNTTAMRRLIGTSEEVELINMPANTSADQQPVVFYDLDEYLEVDLSEVNAIQGTSYSFALNVMNMGYYDMEIIASSTQSELAQIPMTVFVMGTAAGTFTWNGTNGKDVTHSTEITLFSKYTTIRMYFAQTGLNLKKVRIKLNRTAALSGNKEE